MLDPRFSPLPPARLVLVQNSPLQSTTLYGHLADLWAPFRTSSQHTITNGFPRNRMLRITTVVARHHPRLSAQDHRWDHHVRHTRSLDRLGVVVVLQSVGVTQGLHYTELFLGAVLVRKCGMRDASVSASYTALALTAVMRPKNGLVDMSICFGPAVGTGHPCTSKQAVQQERFGSAVRGSRPCRAFLPLLATFGQ
jgi:hypothetical protein